MSNGRKNNPKYSSLWFLCVAVTSITMILSSNDASSQKIYKPLTQRADTIVPKTLIKDTIPRLNDSLALKDSTITDSLVAVTDTLSAQMSKDTLDEPVDYSASDSIVFLVPEKKIVLYSQGSVKKGNVDLAADSIEIDQTTQIVTATFRKDTSGAIVGRPKMIQGETTMESDVIKYNTKTQRGITQHTLTQQGEIFIQGQRVKKINETDFFAYRGEFTTCNLDTPHFAFVTRKMKLVNKKLAISGPIHPEFEGVPVPIYLPFGIFPISQGRHSGFLPPQFTASDQFGLGLQNMGYYKVFNDNFDLETRADIYTFGGWTLNLSPTYRVRYKYNGRMLLTVQRTRIISEDPKLDYNDTRTFRINWNHTVDAKARPGTNFSANVNAGSTKFNRNYIGASPFLGYQNQMSSSIAYSKTWDGSNLTVSANHSQNNNSELINITLPNIGFTANTIYPLQKKEMAGTPKWYEKLGIGLNSSVINEINFYDSLFSFTNLIDTMQWGAQHNIPIQLSLPSVGPLQIAPGISYSNRWFSRKFERRWDAVGKDVDTVVTKKFHMQHDLSFSINVSTALFGKFEKFGKNSSIRAIRHVVRPTFSFSYKPDLTANDFYTTNIADSLTQRFSYYEGNPFSAFSSGMFGGISFGLDNNIEMKVRSKKDTADGGLKKIRVLDGFGFNGSYNLLADTMKLSDVSVYIRSNLFDKINVTAGATIDPYKTDTLGRSTKEYAWKGGKFTPGRITRGNIAVSTSFRSKPKDEKKQQEQEVDEEGMPPLSMDDQMAQLEYARQNPSEFADFNVPWSINISYSLSFSRRFKRDYTGFETEINSNASVGGDFNLTPRWKMGVNSYYDFKSSKIQMLTMYISREMHCWQMSINVTPVGYLRSFNITISPKSGILRDLRLNRTRSFYGDRNR